MSLRNRGDWNVVLSQSPPSGGSRHILFSQLAACAASYNRVAPYQGLHVA